MRASLRLRKGDAKGAAALTQLPIVGPESGVGEGSASALDCLPPPKPLEVVGWLEFVAWVFFRYGSGRDDKGIPSTAKGFLFT